MATSNAVKVLGVLQTVNRKPFFPSPQASSVGGVVRVSLSPAQESTALHTLLQTALATGSSHNTPLATPLATPLTSNTVTAPPVAPPAVQMQNVSFDLPLPSPLPTPSQVHNNYGYITFRAAGDQVDVISK